MSAYIVSNEHIEALVNYAIAAKASYYFANDRDYITKDNADEIGQALLDENYRSVNHRYNETDKAPKYKHKFNWSPKHSAVQILKAISCLDYQSCETDDWDKSRAFAILEGIKSAAIYKLPGYDEAKWGV